MSILIHHSGGGGERSAVKWLEPRRASRNPEKIGAGCRRWRFRVNVRLVLPLSALSPMRCFLDWEESGGMRRLLVVWVFCWLAMPAMATKPVKVHELEEMVQDSSGFSDRRLSHRIGDLTLTERLSAERFESLYEALPGKRSRQSLTQLAAMSAFLPLPEGNEINPATPTVIEQLALLSLAVNYAKETLPKLPNFFASRDVQRFVEFKPVGPHGESTEKLYDALHPLDQGKDIVLYRDGKEVVDAGDRKHRGGGSAGGLTTHGLFGPILGVVLTDAGHGELQWGHWEERTGHDSDHAENHAVAVFRYSVPRAKSHYEVDFCCFTLPLGMQEQFKRYSAYHGEITIDPANGAILRLMIVADMDAADPVRVSDISVDYGYLPIGGANYVCPTRSVSLLVASKEGAGMQETTLNDTVYSDYHRFGSESRVLTDVPDGTQ